MIWIKNREFDIYENVLKNLNINLENHKKNI